MATIVIIRHPAVERIMNATIERLKSTQHSLLIFDNYSHFSREAASLKDVHILLVSSGSPCPKSVLLLFPHLKGVVFMAAGTGSIDLNEATELGIPVANGATPSNADSLAESTVLLMLALQYDLHGTERDLRDNNKPTGWPRARTLKGKTSPGKWMPQSHSGRPAIEPPSEFTSTR